MEFEDYLQSAKNSLFRFEYLQEFDSPEERDFFRKYKVEGGVEIRPLMQDWWDFVDNKNKDGVSMQRVRYVKQPLTDYVKWEMEIFKQSSKHGEEIKILEEKYAFDLTSIGDFWLIDDIIALSIKYDETGKYVGFEIVEPSVFIHAKKYMLENSINLKL